jgi:hypothetical protein
MDSESTKPLTRKPSLYKRFSDAIFGKRPEVRTLPASTGPISGQIKGENPEFLRRTQEKVIRSSIGSNAWQDALIEFATYARQNDFAVPEFEISREAFAPVEEPPMPRKSRTDDETSSLADVA